MTSSKKTTAGRITTRLPEIRLYNTLTRRIEPLKPLKPGEVRFYSCGPTVYWTAHLGNMRTYLFVDTLKRVLQYAGYNLLHVMNITDVGHLTGDNLGDADVGEDRVEKAAREQGKSAWDIAEGYTQVFLRDLERLYILPPTQLVKATDHIKEMIALVKRLEEKGLTYTIADGVYFDTSKFPSYGKLSGQKSGRLAGARVEPAPGKRSPADFALWKLTPPGQIRQMEWDSPWGRGFPGWHIECSAMSMKYLGETFDIHSGGEDHIPIHHENEIAQSEGATGKPFVNIWMHGYFMTVEGKKMGKANKNIFTVQDLIDRGFDPLSFRYLVLQSHYRTTMNFTWEALKAAEQTLARIRELEFRGGKAMNQATRKAVEGALYTDLDTPKALALLHDAQSWDTWQHFEPVFALGLKKKEAPLGKRTQDLIDEREKARASADFEKADDIRQELAKEGVVIEDTPKGPRVIKRS